MAGTERPQKHSPSTPYLDEARLRQIMELLFFGYRDFTGDADALLTEYGFGRAHHRVIYFVGAHPGITVSELLQILKITKQSLSRVLGQLIDEGFISQRSDAADRRRRQMRLTPKGTELERRLIECQSLRIENACREAGEDAVEGFRSVLKRFINEEDRERVNNGPAEGYGSGETLGVVGKGK
ncbi:MAG: winged helix-turn-helix transcriptional regulator [Rhodospirillales bacterium]|nr:winged helix-turn-helix transcriptional regulator [Rhodospirillales bacterium]